MRARWNIASGGSLFIARLLSPAQTPRLREEVRTAIAAAIREAYRALHEAVTAPANGYANPGAIAVHTPAELQMVL